MMLDVLETNEHVRKVTSFPTAAWKTPDGRSWTPQEVLVAWSGRRISDLWACSLLASWIRTGRVEVFHITLPEPLKAHDPKEPAWSFIEALGHDAEREVNVLFGRADLAINFSNDDKGTLFVEFGTCPPGKFVLNLGQMANDLMIVPYNCPYAFIFRPKREFVPLMPMPEIEELAELEEKKRLGSEIPVS